jgi:hypothetical protein
MKKLIGVAALGAALMVPNAAQAHSPDNSMRYCGSSSYFKSQIRANAATSCPFARAVDLRARAYDRRHTLRFGERFSMRVYSYVTWRSYRMRCRVNHTPGWSAKIDCYGGNGAHVQIVQAG